MFLSAPPLVLHEPIAEEYQGEDEIMEGSLDQGDLERGVREGRFWGKDGYPDEPEVHEQGEYYDDLQYYEQPSIRGEERYRGHQTIERLPEPGYKQPKQPHQQYNHLQQPPLQNQGRYQDQQERNSTCNYSPIVYKDQEQQHVSREIRPPGYCEITISHDSTQYPTSNVHQRPRNRPYDQRLNGHYPHSGTEHYTDSAFHSSPCDGSNDYPRSPYTDTYGYTPSPHSADAYGDMDSSDSEAEIDHDEDGPITHRLSYSTVPVEERIYHQTSKIQSRLSQQRSVQPLSRLTSANLRPEVQPSGYAMKSVSQSSIRTTHGKPPLPEHYTGSVASRRDIDPQNSELAPSLQSHHPLENQSTSEQDQYAQPKSIVAPVSRTRWNLKELSNSVRVPLHSANHIQLHVQSTLEDATSVISSNQLPSSRLSSARQGNTFVEGVHMKAKPLKPMLRGSIAGAYESSFPEESVGFIDATLGIYTFA